MKTKIKRHSRAVISVILAVSMLVSCMMVGLIATDAAYDNSERVGSYNYPTPLYIKVGGWNADSAKLIANFKKSGSSDYDKIDLQLFDSTNGIYYASVPENYNQVQILRMSSDGNTQWNYSGVYSLQSTKNMLTMDAVGNNTTGGTWDYMRTTNSPRLYYSTSSNKPSSMSSYVNATNNNGVVTATITGNFTAGTDIYTIQSAGNNIIHNFFNNDSCSAAVATGSGDLISVSPQTYNNDTSTLQNLKFAKATVKSGQAIKSLTVSVNLSTKTYTYSAVAAETKHSVAFSVGTGSGTINPNGSKDVGEETAQTVTATPSEGFSFSSWSLGTGIACADQTANPISITTNNTGSGYTVQANFSRNYYTLSEGVKSNGTFTAVADTTDESGKVPFEENVTVTCTPAKGYKVNTVTYGGETATVDVGNPNRWTFDMPAGDTTVNVEFVKKDNAITASASPVGGGTVWAASSASSDVSLGNYKIGEVFYLRANPDPAYNFTKFTVTYADGTTQDYTDNPQELTLDTTHFSGADGAISVVGYFTAKPTHTVTAVSNNDTMGTVSASPASAYEGQTVTLTYSEGTGVIRSMTTNVAGVTPAKGEGTTYTFTMPDQDVTATATFGKPIVTFKSSGSGSVTATVGGEPITSGTEVDKGASVVFTATPDENYLFSKWTGNATGTTSPVTVTANSNLSVTGNFEMMGYYFISNETSEKMTEVSDGIYVTSSTYSGTYWFKILRENDQYVSKSTASGGGAAMTKYQKYDVQGWEAKDSEHTYGYTNAYSYALPSGSGAVYVVYDANRNQVYFTDSDKGYYPVDIYLKDGTIRLDIEGHGSCDFGETEIVSEGTTDGLTTDATVYSGFATKVTLTTAQIAAGVTIHVKTTTIDSYKNDYYVKGFDVNGGLTRATIEPEYYSKNDPTEANRYKEKSRDDYEDKDAYDKIHPTGGRSYNEFVLDVSGYPDKNIEVTPIYFPKTNDSRNFIRFYAEDFTETVMEKWDGSLAVYPYIESPAYTPYGKYPGQLMVKEGGRYYADIIKTNSSGTALQGLTMNNYAWDDVHYNLFQKDKYSGTERKKVNRQTYDYNEFVIINKILESETRLNDEDIIFSFKYKDEVALSSSNMGQAVYYNDNPTKANDATYGYNNYSTMNNYDDASWKWEDLTDYYDNKVDILGTRIDTTGTDPKANYRPIRVVSNGYDKNATGEYATGWALFKPVDSSGNDAFDPATTTLDHYKLFEVIGGQGVSGHQSQSMLINPDDTKRIHMKYDEAYHNAHWGDSDYPQSQLIQDCAMIPAVISYEYEGLSDVCNDKTNVGGTKNDWAHRSDGRWFYSDPEQLIKANVVVEIANSKKGPWSAASRDYFQEDSVDFTDTEHYNPAANTGLVSGVSAYFTNSDSITKDGTTYTNVSTHTQAYALSDGEHEYNMVTESDPEGNYIFLGWYRLSKDGTDVTLASEDENFNVVANANDVFIARWYKSSSGNLKITHNLLSDSIGQGKVDCKTQVKIMEEGNDTPIATLPNSPTTSAINLTGKYIKSNSPYYLQIELSTTSQKEGEFIFDSFWDNVDGGLLQELDEHGLLTDVTITDNTAVIRLSIASLFTDDGESDPELKTTSLDFFSKMKLPQIRYSVYYVYTSRQYGQQKYLVEGYFEDSDFDNYLEWNDALVTSDGETGWYKLKTDTRAEFYASHCPHESNLRQDLTWNYPSAIGSEAYHKENGQISSTINADSRAHTDSRVQFIFPYWTKSTSDGTVSYDSKYEEDYKVRERSENSTQVTENGKNVKYSKYLNITNDYRTAYYLNKQEFDDDPSLTPIFVSAEPVIYDSTGTTPKYFQYWSVKTLPSDGSPIDASGGASYEPQEAVYRSYEVTRCYYLDFNLTTYQDYIVEAVYDTTESDKTHTTSATITHLDNARNQWNIFSGKGSASTSIGDRIFSNFIIGFDRNDKLQLKSASAKERDYFKTGLLVDRIEKISVANGYAADSTDPAAWTVKSEKAYYEQYNTGVDPSGTTAATKYLTDNEAELTSGPQTTPDENGHMYAVSNIALNKLDNKNRIEFTKAFPNIFTSAGDGHEAGDNTGRKDYVYRAYAYMIDYYVLDSENHSLTYDSKEKCYYYFTNPADTSTRVNVAVADTHCGGIKSIELSDPVYFTIYDIAMISNDVNQSTYNGSPISS